MLRVPKLSFLILAAVAALAGCRTPETDPSVVPFEDEPSARAVDPAVEHWFRSTPVVSPARLLQGDVIRIQIQGKPDYDVDRQIPSDGKIPLYAVSKGVVALGKTLQELEQEIAAIYTEEKLEDAYVTVSIVTAAPRRIYVSGAVGSPGQYPLNAGERLTVLQAVTIAGGARDDADLYGVTVMRVNNETGELLTSPLLDLRSVMEEGSQADNLAVIPGDTVVVPESRKKQVHVLGQVADPGAQRWYRGLTVSRVVTEAGGFLKFAKTSSIRVIRRGSETLHFDFEALLDGAVADLQLSPGDVVHVDEKWY